MAGEFCAIVAMLSVCTVSRAQSGETIEAVWKPHIIAFEYRGYNTIYSCRELAKTLEAILESIGARDDIRARGLACDDASGTARFQIVFHAPIEATPENVHALTQYDSEDALVARIQGQRLPSAEDLERFPAVRKTVAFARNRKLRLTGGDCELVQQVRRQILTRMAVEIVSDNVRCSMAFGNIGPPRLTVSALVDARE